MHIDVIASVNEARSDDLAGKIVLVIDVLRATSNMVTGLWNGCSGIVPVETVQQAKQLQESEDLLGGERYCRKLPGFDLGNSPFEYMDESVKDKRIVMTTTNGTRAIQKALRAHTVIACSFLNVSACAEAAVSFGRDIIVLCSGTQDIFSLEDGLCAGLVVEEILKIKGPENVELNDFAIAMADSFNSNRHRLLDAILECSNGKRLTKLGFRNDIGYCAQINLTDVVPVLQGDTLVKWSLPVRK